MLIQFISHFLTANVFARVMRHKRITSSLLTMAMSPLWQAAAQSAAPEISADWQERGWDLPQGYSPGHIPLFDGLNEACGAWSFDGEIMGDETANSLKGNLEIQSDTKRAMFSGWSLTWRWPADEPEHTIIDLITAIPEKNGFGLLLARFGPMKNSEADLSKLKPEVQPTVFEGVWSAENRTINWAPKKKRVKPGAQTTTEGSSTAGPAFEMVVAADGKISIQNSSNIPRGQVASGKVTVRTGESTAAPVTLTGRHSFRTATEVADDRIAPFLPPEATEISLISNRDGHYARYKVAEADLKRFLDKLHGRDKDDSAREVKKLAIKQKPVSLEKMAKRFKSTGWDPVDNTIKSFSPIKPNGAMTSYYYDRETGIVYQAAGYW